MYIILCTVAVISPLYRYYSENRQDSFYTTNANDVGVTRPGDLGKNGYVANGSECHIYKNQVNKSLPLHRYYSEDQSDHFYTTDSEEIGTTTLGETGNHGYEYEGIEGYCFEDFMEGTIPLYRYWNMDITNHLYTCDVNEVAPDGYEYEGIACFMVP